MKAKKKRTDQESLDLTRTQVLNFNELQEIANYEKRVSKKPALIVAMIGIFSIMTGILYSPVSSFIKGNDVDNTKSNLRKTSEVIKLSDTLTCTKTSTNSVEATTSVETLKLKFDGENLSSYEKNLNITSTAPVLKETPNSMIVINNLLDPLLVNQVPGYTVYKSLTADQTNPNLVNNYTAKLVVDFSLFNITLSDVYKNNDFFNIIYTNNDNFKKVRDSLINSGYNCN